MTLQHDNVTMAMTPCLAVSPDVGDPPVLLQPVPGEHVQLMRPQLGGRQQRPPHLLPASVNQSGLVLGVGGFQLCPLNQATVGIVSLK